MRFQVPQFIDVEDKVFGPFTFKQFVYIAGGAGVSFVLLSVLPRFLAVMCIIPVVLFSLTLAFYRMNNKPFAQMVESFFRYSIGTRLYVWKRSDKAAGTQKPLLPESYRRLEVPKLGNSKLKDMGWMLDTRKGESNE